MPVKEKYKKFKPTHKCDVCLKWMGKYQYGPAHPRCLEKATKRTKNELAMHSGNPYSIVGRRAATFKPRAV